MRRSASGMLRTVAAVLALSFGPPFAVSPASGPAAVFASGGWKEEFEAVCSKTEVATTLSEAELKDLIARCGKLEQAIGAEEESTRKVALRRLRMCRDLYGYVLEYKERNR